MLGVLALGGLAVLSFASIGSGVRKAFETTFTYRGFNVSLQADNATGGVTAYWRDQDGQASVEGSTAIDAATLAKKAIDYTIANGGTPG